MLFYRRGLLQIEVGLFFDLNFLPDFPFANRSNLGNRLFYQLCAWYKPKRFFSLIG